MNSFGHTDWKVSSRTELEDLLDYPGYNPCFPPGHPFEEGCGVIWSTLCDVWSSTESTSNPDNAYSKTLGFYFSGCRLSTDYKGRLHWLWPVRNP